MLAVNTTRPNYFIIKLLVDKGARINQRVAKTKQASGGTPLTMATYYGYKKIVSYLIQSGARVDATDRSREQDLV